MIAPISAASVSRGIDWSLVRRPSETSAARQAPIEPDRTSGNVPEEKSEDRPGRGDDEAGAFERRMAEEAAEFARRMGDWSRFDPLRPAPRAEATGRGGRYASIPEDTPASTAWFA